MIDLYTWLTPNGRKVSILLEETGLPYRVIPIDIGRGAQHSQEYLRINPNGKIPAIVDQHGPGGLSLTMFESGAILIYLAEKAGRFLPESAEGRSRVLQWLFFQAANVGPMLGQAQHFFHYAETKHSYSIDRYVAEARRLYGILDNQLGCAEFFCGDEYSIADIATFPWLRAWKIQGIRIDEFPNVSRWLSTVGARPAVLRERAVLAEFRTKRSAPLNEEERRSLFARS